ncbi:hypothetical protein MLD38_021587 [Melastoma candidum]|nr:hypothetical protein MLD38_021587 [Melastoma candidum]
MRLSKSKVGEEPKPKDGELEVPKAGTLAAPRAGVLVAPKAGAFEAPRAGALETPKEEPVAAKPGAEVPNAGVCCFQRDLLGMANQNHQGRASDHQMLM